MKTYIKPEIVVVNVSAQEMICTSPNVTKGSRDVDGSEGLSRGGRGFWDDDEE